MRAEQWKNGVTELRGKMMREQVEIADREIALAVECARLMKDAGRRADMPAVLEQISDARCALLQAMLALQRLERQVG